LEGLSKLISLLRRVHGPSSNALINVLGRTSDPYTLQTCNSPRITPISTMVTWRLLDLPDKLLVIIFWNLPAHGILACGASCHRLRAVIKESMLLRCRIWSTKHGIQELLSSHSPGLSLSDFFRNVRKWESDWLLFDYEKEVELRKVERLSQGLPGHESFCPTNNEYFLRSGYLIQMHQNRNPGWSHMRPSLHREQLGSIDNAVWTDVRLGDHLTMGGWALDLDQDLEVASLLS
jgi:hypothetical protein